MIGSSIRAKARPIFALLLLCSVATDVRPEAPRPKIALTVRSGDPAEPLLRADLALFGFDVVTVPEDNEPPTPRNLEETARRVGAIAAIRITPLRQGAELWIADRVTGKTVLREVTFAHGRDTSTDLPDEAVVSMRVVELLRASLLEIETTRPGRGELTPPPAASRFVALGARPPSPEVVPSSDLALGVGGGTLYSPGGLGFSGDVRLGLSYSPALLGIAGFARVPLTISTTLEPEGSATSRIGMLGVGCHLRFASAQAHWVPTLDLGLGAVLMHTQGHAAPPFVDASELVTVAAPFVEPAVSLLVTLRLRVGVAATLGIATPRPVVLFGGRTAATWGQPLFLGVSAGMEVAL
ncbi:MAG TPA: hypothetical protein VGJ84_06225 [Polyangiaceae bacterium]